MKKIFLKLRKVDYRHYFCIFITISFILCFFAFPHAIGRLFETVVDFGLSIGYYVCEMFYVPHAITPTVTQLSRFDVTYFLPFTLEEFVAGWSVYWEIIFTAENLYAYSVFLGNFLLNLSKFIVLALPLFTAFYVIAVFVSSDGNNDYDKDSKPLFAFKWFVRRIYTPVKKWVLEFVAFVKERKAYWIIWLLLWLLYFNAYSIVIDFLAFYFYFIVDFDFSCIPLQLFKLLVDLATVITFIPLIGWAVVAFCIVNAVRRKIGFSVLRHNELKNCGFINERPIVYMVVGSMGKKKTTLITDMCLSQESMFRDKAFELMLKNDLKFPRFPWIIFENVLKDGMQKHRIFNLVSCRRYVRLLAAFFEKSVGEDERVKKYLQRHYERFFGVFYENYLFGYDYETYGFYHDDGLKTSNIWEILETYAQLYFIYVCQTSLILSNYSVRTDNLINDEGNLPLWDTDFFKRDTKYADFYSRHSHVLDFDSLRLGKKVVEDNKFANSFEFGVIAITEIGKERGNNLELNDIKKNSQFANQKNDLFNSWLKMVRHSATVDNYPFVRVIVDEQRPESWGADARDLCQIVHIDNCSETLLSMPFFAFGELINAFFESRFNDKYVDYRFSRGDNTLLMHLYKGFYAKLRHYYDRIYNQFGFMKVSLSVEEGVQDGVFRQATYYLSTKKIYSRRFSTDCFSDLFAAKSGTSRFGLNDIPEFDSEKASVKEMLAENSYFFNDLVKVMKDYKIIN